jgi:hypothetical protein
VPDLSLQPSSDAPSNAGKITTEPVIQKLEPLEKAAPVKVFKRMGSSFTPSIKDALAGNKIEKNVVEESQNTSYNEYETFSESFTLEQLTVKWNEFLAQISDRPNLLSTLSNVPELTEGNKLLLKIENSVQEEDVRLIKPELIAWLRKELRNSEIELTTRFEKTESERTFFSDSEKLKIMIEKNPDLLDLKQKFNLDFKD